MINSKELIRYCKDLSILLVEDDNELRSNMDEILKNFFKKVGVAKDGQEALSLYKSYFKEEKSYFDIVLTDIRMPKMNGVHLTENLYTLNVKQCVIVLSAHDESEYLLPLINLGIQQFIKKPIVSKELLEALSRASKNINNFKIKCDLEKRILIFLNKVSSYNTKTKSLHIHGENIYLTKYEILFMQLMTLNTGTIYSNEDIVNYYVLQGESIDIQNIRKLVSKIRKKLPENCLESIYGIGYRLTYNE